MQGNQHVPQTPPTALVPTTQVARPAVPTSTTIEGSPRPTILHYVIRPSNIPGMPGIPGRAIQLPINAAGPRCGQQPIRLASVGPGGQAVISHPLTLRHPGLAMNQRATILGQPTIIRQIPYHHSGQIPTSQAMGLQTQPSHVVIQHQQGVAATAPSQMTADEAMRKGTHLLNTVLARCATEAKKAATQNLIKELIEGKKTEEEFAIALQEEMNYRAAPNSNVNSTLVPFLKVFLPILRQAVREGKTTIQGIEFARQPSVVDQLQVSHSTPNSSTLPVPSPNKVQSNEASTKKKKVPPVPGQKSQWALKKEAREAKKKLKEESTKIRLEVTDKKDKVEKTEKPPRQKLDKPKRQDKQKKQEKQLESLSSTLKDDDDVNDVAAMGGVNLAEESQRIMAAGAELVGTQIRSCKDELFLDVKSLTARVARITTEHNLSEPSQQIVTMISHATQELLKNIVERLGVLAQHRCENLKLNPRYEVTHNVKGQIKFLAELDRIEKRRSEEQEREMLYRVAKSRSKVEDPEQIKLRQKAKDMQRAEQEEVRQREANETALLAIGPRKKLKTEETPLTSVDQPRSGLGLRSEPVRKVKRVNLRDLQVLFELDWSHLKQLIKITASSK